LSEEDVVSVLEKLKYRPRILISTYNQ